jgi:hypothetical protein
MTPKGTIATAMFTVATLTGCAPMMPSGALQLPPTSLQDRQIQTRRFDTSDEEKIQRAGAQVLQDLGFQIDESETRLGVLVASKTRDTFPAGQLFNAMQFALGWRVRVPVDGLQRIRASLVTRPADKADVAVRVTFQRLVWNSDDQLTRAEAINDPALYREFFERLSQSVFLTAQGI